MSEIRKYKEYHTEPEKKEFLAGLEKISGAFVMWLKKCSHRTIEFTENIEEPDLRHNLEKLSEALYKISYSAPESFYEAVLTIYVCFSLDPDSLGTLDRYLSPFYFKDIKKGILTRDKAKEYIQELFLMVQAATPTTTFFTRGGQSHFCIGGRDENGRDCYNEVSELILESLMELPVHIPQITLRWTNDTPKSVFRHVLNCDRTDPNRRIAFTNDDRRIDAYTKICGFPYQEAVNYTLVGCNEPAMLGGMCASTSHANLAHPLNTLLHRDRNKIENVKSFEQFCDIFKKYLFEDLDKIYRYDDLFNLQRSKDVNYVSCLLMNGCIENGKSITQGGVNYAVSNIMFLGNITVIDSLSIIKQFVFDEKQLTMTELLDALASDWKGYEALRMQILKRGKFFGNDDDTSNYTARFLYNTLYEYIKNKRTVFGYPVLIGDHTGYRLHFKFFGEGTKATPDGKFSGEPLSYGIFQTGGKDRQGLTALINSITKFDTYGISSATVTNFSLDPTYTQSDDVFAKTADMLETYFKCGGIHFQLNYTSREELLNAKANPEKYRNLKVRITGYADYFSNLEEPIQDSVIRRYKR